MKHRVYAGLAVVALLLLGLWALRLRIAGVLVDRRLDAAGVPASYRVTEIGPFLERMEDVRIGDPAHPDLVAKRIDVTVGYGLTGPVVRGVAVEGVVLAARIDADGLHLGALDRLLPKSGGKVALPDLDVDLRDVRLALATPNGAVRVALSGKGNPAERFDGRAQVSAPALRLASCSLAQVSADLAVATGAGAPRVEGPVRILGTGCPGLSLGRGELRMVAASDKTFEHVSLRARPTGFAGSAGPARFAGVSGRVAAAGTLGHLRARGALDFAHLALPDQAAMVEGVAIPAGLPVTPTATRATRAVARLLRDAAASVEFEGAIEGLGASVRIARAALVGGDGARIATAGGEGLRWAPPGWQVDSNVASSGGDLPALRLRIRQAGEGAPLSGVGRLDPYAAGTARIAASRLSFAWDDGTGRFDMLATVDGPLGDGFVRGLSVPLDGRVSSNGFAINPGCRYIGFRELRQSSFTFDPARIRVCGRPLVARSGAGSMRLDATAENIRLMGRSGASPILVTADRLRVSEQGFRLAGLLAVLGKTDADRAPPSPSGEGPGVGQVGLARARSDRPHPNPSPEGEGLNGVTRLEVTTLDGRFGRTIGGTFAGANGAIANVPLDLKGAAGDWAFKGGALAIKGGLQVSDQAATPRFFPLDADMVTLDLVDGRITAAGILRAPGRGTEIARVALAHDLSAGTGHADLEVKGIAFVPKGLQPEALTPLTLGVVANVAGTVNGHGRIDWSPTGVSSTGDFGTDRLDLAAAFGPVSGIKGRIVFTDLLGLVSAPRQTATIAELNPGVVVSDGTVHFQLTGNNRVVVEDATFPFAGGQLLLDPATLDFGKSTERRLTFRLRKVDAAAFVQQLDFPNISATGTFNGTLPMIFDDNGGRIEQGYIAAEGGGTLAYVGELTTAQLGTMGKLAFDALKAIRYSALDISLDGRLDGEMVSKVRFTGVREATPEQSLVTRLLRNLPFRFNIAIRAPFRQLAGSARAYMDPRLLLNQARAPAKTTPAEPPIQTPESGDVR